MKLLKTAIAGFALISSASLAHAESKNGWYVGADISAVFTEDSSYTDTDGDYGDYSLDDSFGLGLNVGYKIADFRLEAEYGYTELDIDSQTLVDVSAGTTTTVTENLASIDVMKFMGNVYYDIPVSWKLQPYVGLGAGVANIDIGAVNFVETEDTVFAYQGTVGFNYDLSDKHTVYTGYKYFDTADASVVGGTAAARFTRDSDITNHSFLVGYRYNF